MLFSFYLNDLHDYLTRAGNTDIDISCVQNDVTLYINILVLLFADDTILLAKSADDFQKCLNDFSQYCNMWKLNINLTKTKVIVFGSTKSTWDKLKFTYNGLPLEIVDNYKYLETVFTPNGKFCSMINHLAEQGNKAMYLLYRRTII